jgi:hypothetical protein
MNTLMSRESPPVLQHKAAFDPANCRSQGAVGLQWQETHTPKHTGFGCYG